jgi:hypothetical protein
MAETAGGNAWPLPEQTTQPPDVVYWLTQLGDAADADVTAVNAAVVATNARLLYGPVASLPATLPEGVVYFGWA